MKILAERSEANAETAWLILNDPVRYEGLPVEWAKLWVSRHGPARKPVVKAERTVEDRLAAHEERQRKKKIAWRRERWSQRQWRTSRKGNRFTNVHGFHIVVFERNGQWSIGIKDRVADEEMTFLLKRYPSEEEAMEAAFDALIYQESKRSLTNLQFVQEAKTA
jgi:hypothetical protein